MKDAGTAKSIFGERGWWEAGGKHSLLRKINPVRFRYIEECVGGVKGKRVLDCGCGGGILSESLARSNAKVVGIDRFSGCHRRGHKACKRQQA